MSLRFNIKISSRNGSMPLPIVALATAAAHPERVQALAKEGERLSLNFRFRTGSDALCQAIEAYTSIAANEITDSLAERAIRLISGNLADHAFMTGIMSLMPALLQTPMDEILDSLPENFDIESDASEELGKGR